MRGPRSLHGAVTGLLVLSLLLVGPVTTPALAQGAEGPQAALERFETLTAGLARLEEALPATPWTQEDLAFELAFEEPEIIASWVHDRIAYETYRGLLRGADGTLQARAGNALDQSVLLAGLLFDAGYTARIARATLPSEAAADLVASMRAPSTIGDLAAADAANAYLDAVGGEPGVIDDVQARAEATVEARRQAVRTTVASLTSALRDAGIELGGEDIATIVEEARDYAWVEYRLSDADPWSAAHPAAPEDADWTADLVPVEILDGEVPPELQHRFRFRAMIERRLGDELEVVAVTEAWERPVANLNGVALSYASVPDGYLADEASAGGETDALAATNFVVPVLNEELAPGAQYFDLLGNTVPPDAASSQAGGLFQTLGGALADATSELSGEEDAVALTAHWLEFTLIEPGGRETTHRRVLVDRLGDERRRTGEVSGPLDAMTDAELLRQLQVTHTFMLAPGRYPAAYVAGRSLHGLRSVASYLHDLYQATTEDPGAAPLPGGAVGDDTRALPLLSAFGAFDDDPLLAAEAPSYRATPSLALTSSRWDGSGERTDIVHNARRAFAPGDGGMPVPDAEAAMLHGVWESAIEGLLLGSGPEVRDTLAFFEAAGAAGSRLRVLAPGAVDALQSLDMPTASEEAMRRDLERGYAVVTVGSPPASADHVAWWRVDPRSGETLGRGGDGRGQAITEYVSKVLSVEGVLISGVFGGAGFALCKGAGGATGCCLADAATGAAIGLAGGLYLAFHHASAATSLLVGFGIDFAGFNYGLAGAVGVPVPTWCAAGAPPPTEPSEVSVAATCPLPRAFASIADLRVHPVVRVATTVRFA